MDTEKRRWHTLEGKEALTSLKSNQQQGLSGAEAAQRLEQYGPNALSEGKKKTVIQVFLEQFKDRTAPPGGGPPQPPGPPGQSAGIPASLARSC